MATCTYCNREMTLADSCTERVLHFDGVAYALVANGQERRFGVREDARRRCHDCGVQSDQHHHPGCDMAECPRCRGQLFACGCWFDEYGPNPDEAETDDRADTAEGRP